MRGMLIVKMYLSFPVEESMQINVWRINAADYIFGSGWSDFSVHIPYSQIDMGCLS